MRPNLRRAHGPASAEVAALLGEHFRRGLRVQFLLRAALAAFLAATIIVVPPDRGLVACWLVVAGYALWTGCMWLWIRRSGSEVIGWLWIALVVDCVALAGLTVIADASREQSWTADVVVAGFVLIPLMAATQLSPRLCAAIAGPAVVGYLAANAATREANGEPWSSVIVRSVAFAGLALGAVALSRVQQSRVRTIIELADSRTVLLNDIGRIEARERTALAEDLHDGALQYLLAARHDLEQAREDCDPEAFERLERALIESSTLLRGTVATLHPAVLREAGLARAIRDLASGLAAREGLAVDVDVADWPDGATAVDEALYGCARELLVNVAKHAQASSVRIVLSVDEGAAWLVIADDGRGLDAERAAAQLADGHIGLASLRARLAAIGGSLTLAPAAGGGTTATVSAPLA